MLSQAGGPKMDVSLGLGDIVEIRGNKNDKLVSELVKKVLAQLEKPHGKPISFPRSNLWNDHI
jgi:hypothetical protein